MSEKSFVDENIDSNLFLDNNNDNNNNITPLLYSKILPLESKGKVKNQYPVFSFHFADAKKRLSNKYLDEINEYSSCKEMQLFVGLKGINLDPKSICSHFSLFFDGENPDDVYVDECMKNVFVYFKNGIVYEGEVGTQSVYDMKPQKLQIDESHRDPNGKAPGQFGIDKGNNLLLIIGNPLDKYGFKYDHDSKRWTEYNINYDKLKSVEKNAAESGDHDAKGLTKNNFEFDIIGSVENAAKSGNLLVESNVTNATAIEISDNLFLLNKTKRLYHPPWRNCSLREGVLSTFYRFFHKLPVDKLVFEVGDSNANSSIKVDSAIIMPQIDIGFRGNIESIFLSSNVPGVFEYSDHAFNFYKFEKLLPMVKTDVLFFNNGKNKVGLYRHRTRCQIAAASLFGYACTIYGPGTQVRDFVFEKGDPCIREQFNYMRKALIATYGTLLKIKDDKEFDFAIKVICQELNIEGNQNVYYNMMEELKKDFY